MLKCQNLMPKFQIKSNSKKIKIVNKLIQNDRSKTATVKSVILKLKLLKIVRFRVNENCGCWPTQIGYFNTETVITKKSVILSVKSESF